MVIAIPLHSEIVRAWLLYSSNRREGTLRHELIHLNSTIAGEREILSGGIEVHAANTGELSGYCRVLDERERTIGINFVRSQASGRGAELSIRDG